MGFGRGRSEVRDRRWTGGSLVCGGLLLLAVIGGVLAAGASVAAASVSQSWLSAGASPGDSRWQPELLINPFDVHGLAPKWVFTTNGDVSATPTVSNGVVYFPDWGGYLNAVDASTGALIWQKQISSYDGAVGAISRNSPVIFGNELILGDTFSGAHSSGAHVFAVSTADGHLLWRTQVDGHQAAVITASPVVAGGEVIVGVSSVEVALALNAGYQCCTFRGSVVALNPSSGQILWKTYTVPPNSGPCATSNPAAGCGYSGGAVWDNPAVDTTNGVVYVGTGNNYTAPDSAVECEQQALASHTSDAGCTASDDYFDAVLALNLQTGAVLWSHKVEGWDAFTVACHTQPPGVTWCPTPASPDYDFGSGPNLIYVPSSGGGSTELVGIGQKSGVYWALNAATGRTIWDTLVGPGSSLGGIMWGTAYDLRRIYVPEANPFHTAYKLSSGWPVTGGAWTALNPTNGAIDWQTPAPLASAAMGPTSVAGGVVYAGTTAPAGNNMFALDAFTGQILWRFASGGSVNSSPAIANGTVYWGSGYSQLAGLGYTGNNKLYAFTLNGQ